jgi:NTF2 fold immunity protein of polymorphic toxin system component
MKPTLLTITLFVMLVIPGLAQYEQAKSFVPKDGFVPNAETAVKVAEAVLIPVYGEKQIINERPLKAALDGDVWTVTGTLHRSEKSPEAHCVGGTAVVHISKTSSQILFMMHYK